MVLPAAVSGIAFHSIDNSIFYSFHDACMVGFPILWASRSIRIVPAEEDDHTRNRLFIAVDPLIAVAEPLYIVYATAYFGMIPSSIYPHSFAHQLTKQAHHSTLDPKPYQDQ